LSEKAASRRARDVVGLDIAGAMAAAKLYANGSRPGGMLIPKGKVGADGRKLIKDTWNDELAGVEKSNSVHVMGEEFDYKPLGMSNVDAEFVNNRKLSRSEVAAIFRVPAHKIGIMDNATFSNIEHQSLEYVTDTLMPIAVPLGGRAERSAAARKRTGRILFRVPVRRAAARRLPLPHARLRYPAPSAGPVVPITTSLARKLAEIVGRRRR
jgi:phage portal protein BeeE